MKDENDSQLKRMFQGDDLSRLCTNERRQRGRGYASIDELLTSEFEADPLEEGKASQLAQESWCSPAVLSPATVPKNGADEREYKMILKDLNLSPKESRPRNKCNSLSKNRMTRRVKKTISQYEFSRRLLHQSLSSQFKSLNIDTESHTIFSIGKHLYSNNFNGKIKVSLGGEPSNGVSLPIFRPIKKLQEWSKCQQAESMVSQRFTLLAQKNCTNVQCSDNLNIESHDSTNYLTFFEEGLIINLVVDRNNLTSWVREYQVYSANPNAESVVFGVVSSYTDLKNSVGGDVRICDLIGYLKNKIKGYSSTSQSGLSSQPVGGALRSP